MVTEVIPEVWAALEKAEGQLSVPRIHQRLVSERRVACEEGEVVEAIAVLLKVGAVFPASRKGFYRARGGRG